MTKDGLTLILSAADNSPWREDIVTLLDAPARQSLKTWLSDKRNVETLQVTVSEGRVMRAWAPGPRAVDTSRASFARFGESGSRREYAGVTATACTETLWAGFDTDMHTYLIYRVTN